MCSQDDAPDTKKHFTRAPVQDGSAPRDRRASFRPFPFLFLSPTETPAGAAASRRVLEDSERRLTRTFIKALLRSFHLILSARIILQLQIIVTKRRYKNRGFSLIESPANAQSNDLMIGP